MSIEPTRRSLLGAARIAAATPLLPAVTHRAALFPPAHAMRDEAQP